MDNKKKTVGQLAEEALANADPKQPIFDTCEEMYKNFIPNIEECIKRHSHWTEPFYVVVLNKKERIENLKNIIRQYFIARRTLPSADLDQSVFKYYPSNGTLEFLWVVPDWQTIEIFIANESILTLEQLRLLKYCKLFKNKQLVAFCGK